MLKASVPVPKNGGILHAGEFNNYKKVNNHGVKVPTPKNYGSVATPKAKKVLY